MSNSKQPLPSFRSDKEAEDFVDNADLSQFDLTGGEPVRYEFKSKDANVSMRMPRQLLDAVKAKAQREGIPYQRFIRQTLEHAVAGAGKAK